MEKVLKPVLADLRRAYETLYGDRLVELILFGSRARGDARADSDIDVLVVLKGAVEPSDEVARCGVSRSRICLEYDVLISCTYVSEDQRLGEQSPLLRSIRREGVPV